MKEKTSLKVRVQKLGTALSNMVMPNIPILIAWGVLTMFFIPDGFTPNSTFAAMVGPMLVFLIPVMIGYTGGRISMITVEVLLVPLLPLVRSWPQQQLRWAGLMKPAMFP